MPVHLSQNPFRTPPRLSPFLLQRKTLSTLTLPPDHLILSRIFHLHTTSPLDLSSHSTPFTVYNFSNFTRFRSVRLCFPTATGTGLRSTIPNLTWYSIQSPDSHTRLLSQPGPSLATSRLTVSPADSIFGPLATCDTLGDLHYLYRLHRHPRSAVSCSHNSNRTPYVLAYPSTPRTIILFAFRSL